MISSLELFSMIFALSLLVWGLLYIYANFSIKKFIIHRYEEETKLLETSFFRRHVPFVRYLPDLFAAGFYGTHLLMCIWGWPLLSKRKVFRDIKDPNQVIRSFSKEEIRRVKFVFICGVILFAHGIAFIIFRFIWPETFS